VVEWAGVVVDSHPQGEAWKDPQWAIEESLGAVVVILEITFLEEWDSEVVDVAARGEHPGEHRCVVPTVHEEQDVAA